MKIKAILTVYNSKRDRNGNTYWAFRWTDTKTGMQATGRIAGGESNVTPVVRHMGLDWENVYYTRQQLGKREFRELTKDWPYAGCTMAEIIACIHAHNKR